MIIVLRTDKPEAEIGLFDSSGTQLAYKTWHAHRELSTTLLSVFNDLLDEAGVHYSDLTGAVFYEGPGSFTGLRIGAAFINALKIPVANCTGQNWIKSGINSLNQNKAGYALPQYGSEARITRQKK